ncbi:MAG: acetyl ornithine aminotransferase family protein [Hadesarchaea archaeon]|nr:MAG: acetyl ornithine aminotransferase family protein [Hadesarchaea archaeon]
MIDTTGDALSRPAWVKGAPRIVTPIPGPRAKELVSRDERVMSPSYTRAEPIVATEGWGCYVKDIDGNVLLDLSSGMFVLNYGYSHPRLIRAVEQQLRKLTHFAGTDFYYEAQVELAERLVDITPGKFPKHVYFGNSGAEAVEAAFKCVRWHTRRPHMISFTGSFHGRTFGAMSLSGAPTLRREHFAPLVPEVSLVQFPDPYRGPFKSSSECIEHIRNRLGKDIPEEKVAAVITEPIQGTAGYVIPPSDFYPMLKELCEEKGWIFIVDEIQTGLGRSGKMFAIEHWDVVPDIVCVAKALAGGIAPIGATIADAEVMDWEPGAHASTFGGNLVACVAAIEGLKILEEQNLVKRAEELGEMALKRLEEMKEDSRLIGDVRGKGLLLAVDLVKDKRTKDFAVKEREMLVRESLNRGLIVFRGGKSAIRIAPPLTIGRRELELGLDIFEEALKEVERKC